MIVIRHRYVDAALKRVKGKSLVGANLGGARLANAQLSGADLSCANLSIADLSESNLSGANLSEARLARADLSHADLTGANLSNAHLIGANLSNAHLTGADLGGAYLIEATLIDVDLNGTDLSDSLMHRTIFALCGDLHEAIGLETVTHAGPSSLDSYTLRANVNKLPLPFLKGVGYKDEEIKALIELYTTKVIEFYSCFIAHSKEDGKFADRLRVDLLAKNVTCFHYAFDLHGGQLWREQINRAIKVHDKLLVVCSREALQSENVVEEIITAIEEEDANGAKKLFPIRLDNYVLEDEIAELARKNFWSGKWRMDWVPRMRAYHVCDFRKWKNHDSYEREFDRLLKDIKAPPPSPSK